MTDKSHMKPDKEIIIVSSNTVAVLPCDCHVKITTQVVNVHEK